MGSREGLRVQWSDPKTGETIELVDKIEAAKILGLTSSYFLHAVGKCIESVQLEDYRRYFWRLSDLEARKKSREERRLRCIICKRYERGGSDTFFSFQRELDLSWYSFCKKCLVRFISLGTPNRHVELPGETLEQKQTWGWLLLAYALSEIRRNFQKLEAGRWSMRFKRKRILLVEEHTGLRKLLTDSLTRDGWIVISKATLKAGMRKMRKRSWDGLYASYHLGTKTVESLIRKARRQGPDRPIIVAFDREPANGTIEFMMEMGVKGLDKPFNFGEVRDYFRKSWLNEEEVRRR